MEKINDKICKLKILIINKIYPVIKFSKRWELSSKIFNQIIIILFYNICDKLILVF